MGSDEARPDRQARRLMKMRLVEGIDCVVHGSSLTSRYMQIADALVVALERRLVVRRETGRRSTYGAGLDGGGL